MRNWYRTGAAVCGISALAGATVALKISDSIGGLDHGVGHLISMTTEKRMT